MSDATLADHVVAIVARVAHIITTPNAEWNAAQHVAADPATQDARAPLATRHLVPCARVSLLAAAGTLHGHWVALVVNPWHSLILPQLLSLEELGELLLAVTDHLAWCAALGTIRLALVLLNKFVFVIRVVKLQFVVDLVELVSTHF